MPCNNESCQYLITGGARVTIVIDGQMRQFCRLPCTITFLDDLFEQHADSRKRVSRN